MLAYITIFAVMVTVQAVIPNNYAILRELFEYVCVDTESDMSIAFGVEVCKPILTGGYFTRVRSFKIPYSNEAGYMDPRKGYFSETTFVNETGDEKLIECIPHGCEDTLSSLLSVDNYVELSTSSCVCNLRNASSVVLFVPNWDTGGTTVVVRRDLLSLRFVFKYPEMMGRFGNRSINDAVFALGDLAPGLKRYGSDVENPVEIKLFFVKDHTFKLVFLRAPDYHYELWMTKTNTKKEKYDCVSTECYFELPSYWFDRSDLFEADVILSGTPSGHTTYNYSYTPPCRSNDCKWLCPWEFITKSDCFKAWELAVFYAVLISLIASILYDYKRVTFALFYLGSWLIMIPKFTWYFFRNILSSPLMCYIYKGISWIGTMIGLDVKKTYKAATEMQDIKKNDDIENNKKEETKPTRRLFSYGGNSSISKQMMFTTLIALIIPANAAPLKSLNCSFTCPFTYADSLTSESSDHLNSVYFWIMITILILMAIFLVMMLGGIMRSLSIIVQIPSTLVKCLVYPCYLRDVFRGQSGTLKDGHLVLENDPNTRYQSSMSIINGLSFMTILSILCYLIVGAEASGGVSTQTTYTNSKSMVLVLLFMINSVKSASFVDFTVPGDYICDKAMVSYIEYSQCEIDEDKNEDCAMVASTDADVRLGHNTCIQYQKDNKTKAEAAVSFANLYGTCDLVWMYDTCFYDLYQDTWMKCGSTDKCSQEKCLAFNSAPDTTFVASKFEYDEVNDYPGIYRCDRVQSSKTSCDWTHPITYTDNCCDNTNMCNYYSSGMVCKGPIYSVYLPRNCRDVPMLKFSVTDSSGVHQTAFAEYLTDTTITVGDFSFTLIGRYETQAVDLGNNKVVVNNVDGTAVLVPAAETGTPQKNMIGDYQFYKESLSHPTKTMGVFDRNLYEFSITQEGTVATIAKNGLNQIKNGITMPGLLNGNLWSYSRLGYIETNRTTSGAAKVRIETVGLGYTIRTTSNLVIPRIAFEKMEGCYSCDQGAIMYITMSTDAGSGTIYLETDSKRVSLIKTSYEVTEGMELHYEVYFQTDMPEPSFTLTAYNEGRTKYSEAQCSGVLIAGKKDLNAAFGQEEAYKTGSTEDPTGKKSGGGWFSVDGSMFKDVFNGAGSVMEYILVVVVMVVGLIVLSGAMSFVFKLSKIPKMQSKV